MMMCVVLALADGMERVATPRDTCTGGVGVARRGTGIGTGAPRY